MIHCVKCFERSKNTPIVYSLSSIAFDIFLTSYALTHCNTKPTKPSPWEDMATSCCNTRLKTPLKPFLVLENPSVTGSFSYQLPVNNTVAWRTESSLYFFSWSVIWATIFLVRRDFSQVFIYSWFPIPRQFLCERISGFDTWFCYMVEPPYNEPLYRAIFVWP